MTLAPCGLGRRRKGFDFGDAHAFGRRPVFFGRSARPLRASSCLVRSFVVSLYCACVLLSCPLFCCPAAFSCVVAPSVHTTSFICDLRVPRFRAPWWEARRRHLGEPGSARCSSFRHRLGDCACSHSPACHAHEILARRRFEVCLAVFSLAVCVRSFQANLAGRALQVHVVTLVNATVSHFVGLRAIGSL